MKNFDDICNRFDTIPACDRRTDRRTTQYQLVTDGRTDGHTSCIASRVKKQYFEFSAILSTRISLPWSFTGFTACCGCITRTTLSHDVSPSVTRRHSVETAKHHQNFSLPGRYTILVFPYHDYSTIPTETP